MNSRLRRLLLALTLALLSSGKSSAQVVMTVDWSNQAAVKFTATSNFCAIDYPGATNFKFSDGIALLNFFSSPVNVVDLDGGSPAPTSNLTDSANVVSSTAKFD